jgi:glycosyltransferase involved in cell wall biosynthesis
MRPGREAARRPRLVVVEPPATNRWTGGYLFNARVVAAMPARCARQECDAVALRVRVADLPTDDVLVLDSLFLPLLDPAAYAAHRVVQIVHSLPEDRAARVAAALAAAAGCITTSAFMAQSVLARAPGARVRVVLPGVTATVRVDAGAHDRVPRVLTVGNFERRKGHLLLLAALAALRDLAWTWTVVGDLGADPACSGEFTAAVAASGLASRIHMLGRRPPADVQELMAAADVFALLSANEPYGMVYAESIASGTPVVAWRQGGAREIVADGVTGLLATPGDVAAAGVHLRALLAQPELRAQMRHACAAAPVRSWQDCARDFVAACDDLAGGTP